MAADEGWAIEPEIAELIRPQSPQDVGKTHMPTGYYRIDLPTIEPDNLYEFETVHFINVNRKLNIGGFPHLVAQLRHGEIVHVYGTGENSASLLDDEGTEVAPLATLAGGRRRAHVRLPYFGAANQTRNRLDDRRFMDGANGNVSRPPVPVSNSRLHRGLAGTHFLLMGP